MLTHTQCASFDRSAEPLALGHWHELRVSRTARNGLLQVDKQKVVEGMAAVRTQLCPCWRVWGWGWCLLSALETRAATR